MSARDEPHLHGGDPQRDLARFGVASRPMLDFSVNLSPLGPPEAVRRLWPDLWRQAEPYPSLEGEGVRAFYRQRFGLAESEVLPGNGATELIYLAPRGLGLERIAVLSPAYDDYRRASCLAGAEVLGLETPDLGPPSADLLEQALSQADALFVGHPNNPTGALADPELLRQAAVAFPTKWLLVDESFIQFSEAFPETSLAFGAGRPDNVLVFHSLTKFYALAGLRLGAVVAAPEVIERLRHVKEPWTVNGIADRVARELAGCGEYELRLRHLIGTERPWLEGQLAALPGVRVWPSAANFLLARWAASPLEELLRGLLVDGLCVRDSRNFAGLDGGFFRVAVRGHDDNARLVKSLAGLVRRLGQGRDR